eukprot:8162859-Heterocapsa_arctica.AAC.1
MAWSEHKCIFRPLERTIKVTADMLLTSVSGKVSGLMSPAQSGVFLFLGNEESKLNDVPEAAPRLGVLFLCVQEERINKYCDGVSNESPGRVRDSVLPRR